ncbi:FkbM family methyltransferase [Patescibacteria group bacterium]|nr:FkbM family methyltransferase [Patescibacteria group bacterium]
MTKNSLKYLLEKNKNYYLSQLQEHFPPRELICNRNIPCVVFGAARMGKIFVENLQAKNIKVSAIVDNNPKLHDRKIGEAKIISFVTAKKLYLATPILVASLMYESEIYSLLKKAGFKYIYPLGYLNILYPDIFISSEYENTFNSLFSKRNLIDILQTEQILTESNSKKIFENLIKFRLSLDKKYIKLAQSSKKTYFDESILKLNSQEILADCGAFDGDTVLSFCKTVKNKFMKIYSFEPDTANYIKLQKISRKIDHKRIIPIKRGVFYKEGTIDFSENSSVDSRIIKKNLSNNHAAGNAGKTKSIRLSSLDFFFRDKPKPTIIKMDIEGVEREALLGAKKIIRQTKPKLIISIYHHAADLWKLILLIKKLNPSYKLFVRHYSNELVDTICIAV